MRALGLAIFMALAASLCALPRRLSHDLPKRAPHPDAEFSGNGADEPVRGSVRVVKVSPHFLRHSAVKRSPYPAFLALGRAGPSAHARAPTAPLSHLSAEGRKKQGLDMWQRVMQKSEPSKE
ncbi:DAN domain family member 5-like, partial [Clarias magur]